MNFYLKNLQNSVNFWRKIHATASLQNFFKARKKCKKFVIASERTARSVAIHYARSAFLDDRNPQPKKSAHAA